MKRAQFLITTCFLTLIILTGFTLSAFAEGMFANITQHQKDQLKTLATETRDKTKRERESLRHARRDLWQAYSSFDLDTHKVKAAQARIATAQLNLLNMHLENEIALRGILTEDQFQTLRQNMVKRMRGHEMMTPPPQDAAIDKLLNKETLESAGLNKDQTRRIMQQIKPTPEKLKVFDNLRRNSRQLLDIYSTYTLDSKAARKLINSIHNNQVALAQFQNNRQQFLRTVLTQDQFEKLRQEIIKRIGEFRAQKDKRD